MDNHGSRNHFQPDPTHSSPPDQLPPDHPPVLLTAQSSSCPFASMSANHRTHNPKAIPTPPLSASNADTESSAIPTTTQTTPIQAKPRTLSSSTTSQPNPSQCPIRLLDALPPEDIASYISTHKHSLPRSHELCIKRYQSNTESISRLDAKYGDLESMIKGLGSKHQVFLPNNTLAPHIEDSRGKGEGDREAQDGGAEQEEKIEKWADGVEPSSHPPLATEQETAKGDEEREGRFERQLEDVRLGESPSRPWGYRVPESRQQSPSQEAGRKEQQQQQQRVARAGDGERPRQIIFNGPVIIGYPPEEAARFLRELGMQGPAPS